MDDIVIAALERDEVDVEIGGNVSPPVGSLITLIVNGDVRTEWKIVAVRKQDKNCILTCRRHQPVITGPKME